MEIKHFQNYDEFAFCVIQENNKIDDDRDIGIIAKYSEASEIINSLVTIGVFKLMSINLDFEYDKEFIINIFGDELYCEPMYRQQTGYITDMSTNIYILDNCSSSVLPYCGGVKRYEVNISDDEDFETDGCNLGIDDECVCESCKHTKKNEVKNFSNPPTLIKSKYKINNRNVSKEEFNEKYNEIKKQFD